MPTHYLQATNRHWNENTHTHAQPAYGATGAYGKNHASGVQLTSKI